MLQEICYLATVTSNLSFLWSWQFKTMGYGNNSGLVLIFVHFYSGCCFMMPVKNLCSERRILILDNKWTHKLNL